MSIKIKAKFDNLFLIFLLFFSLTCCDQEEKKKVVKQSGDTKLVFYEKDGKKHGKLKKYQNDTLKMIVTYKNGQLNDSTIYYYPNGNKELLEIWESGLTKKAFFYYKDGTLKQKQTFYQDSNNYAKNAKIYYKDGNLKQVRYYNKKGKLVDFKSFKRNGKRARDIKYKKVLVLSKKDTIRRGEKYSARITIGNMSYDSISVCLLDQFKDNYSFDEAMEYFGWNSKGKKLPNLNDTMAIYEDVGVSVGKHVIEGFAFDIRIVNDNDTLVMATSAPLKFKHSYYVKPKTPDIPEDNIPDTVEKAFKRVIENAKKKVNPFQ